MIILRAFLFSFHILWQYIIVFPVLLIGLLGLTWLTFLAALDTLVVQSGYRHNEFLAQIGFYVVGFLVILLIAAIYTFPMLVGIRLGLTTRGHKPAGNYWSLILPAAGYGVLAGIGAGLIALLGAYWYLQSISLSLPDILVLLENATFGYLIRNVFTDIPLVLRISMISWVVFTAFYTALLVPLASVAIGRDPSGNPHTPFAGFGAGFVPLLGLVIISYGLSEFSFPILEGVAGLFGLGDRLSGTLLVIQLMADGQIPKHLNWEIAVILGLVLVFWLWTICILCAGATLVYLDRFEKEKAEKATKFKVDRLAPDEVRAIWQQRMPGQAD